MLSIRAIKRDCVSCQGTGMVPSYRHAECYDCDHGEDDSPHCICGEYLNEDLVCCNFQSPTGKRRCLICKGEKGFIVEFRMEYTDSLQRFEISGKDFEELIQQLIPLTSTLENAFRCGMEFQKNKGGIK